MDKKWLKNMEYYVWFNFCARMQIATIDHNMHRKQLTTAKGQPIYKKKYSKRSKRWYPEPVLEKKEYSYIPYLMAHIMKARIHNQGLADRVMPLSENHPRHLAATIDH